MHAAGKDHVVANAHQLTHGAVARQRRRHRRQISHRGRRLCQHVIHVFVQGLIIQAIKMAVSRLKT
jgi:hypothetical protein